MCACEWIGPVRTLLAVEDGGDRVHVLVLAYRYDICPLGVVSE